MKLEEQVMKLLDSRLNTKKIKLIAKELEMESDFDLRDDIDELKGI